MKTVEQSYIHVSVGIADTSVSICFWSI